MALENFRESLEEIHSSVSNRSNPSEDDVQNIFIESEFFRTLGSEGFGYDLRSEFTLPDNQRPDFIAEDKFGSPRIVYEFKEPGESLDEHVSQLERYAERLNPIYGVLTNGKEIWVYQESFGRPDFRVKISGISDDNLRTLHTYLKIPERDIRDVERVREYIDDLKQIGLDEDLGEEYFFESFALGPGSPFTELVLALKNLLQELRDDKEAKFVQGAYEYWESAYLQEPDETPDSWENYIDGNQDKRDFMYALETAHALLGRILLIKATEDQGVFGDLTFKSMFQRIVLSRPFGSINDESYPIAVLKFFSEMNDDLVQGLFEDDIFLWWTDAFGDNLSEGPAEVDPQQRYTGPQNGKASRKTRKQFSESVADLMLSLLKFDFSEIQGDPLGNLYQRYFDSETRKALGEFYTPQEVVELMMDRAEYDTAVSNERLIDPACGSGTFLVEAAERYLEDVERYNDNPDWKIQIKELCNHPHIVGLDIHPFAVLMAKIRFMVAILPKYKLAKQQDPNYTVSRLPVYRTDTLVDETQKLSVDIGSGDGTQMRITAISEEGKNLQIPVKVPVEAKENDQKADEDGFLQPEIKLPKWDRETGSISAFTEIQNEGDYFGALQAVLDVAKEHVRREEYTYQQGLEEKLTRYVDTDLTNYSFFEEYVNDILDTVKMLQRDYGDGRLFKMFEDGVLSLVLKNYITYEYVTANPPYVRIQNLTDWRTSYLNEVYPETATGNYDIYCSFYQRGTQMLTDDGSLVYIAPNVFMATDYGEGLRRYLLENVRIEESIDFRDSGVFEDATTYPLILKVEKDSQREERIENEIKAVRIRANVNEDSGSELDEEVVDKIDQRIDSNEYRDEVLDVFEFQQRNLDAGYWSICPPQEFNIMQKMERKADTVVGDLVESVFAGTQTSMNDVFVVEPVDFDRIGLEEGGDIVEVEPSGEEGRFRIESDVLAPWIQGRDIGRWRGDWSKEHVILPYSFQDGYYNLLSQDNLREEYPLTWEYFKQFEDDLRSRESDKWRESQSWYEFGYPKSMTRFPEPKIIGREISNQSNFMVDPDGTWFFKTGYGISIEDSGSRSTKFLAGFLNSAPVDFYFKHIAVLKQGRHYAYRTGYIDLLPTFTQFSDEVIQNVSLALKLKDTQAKIRSFPEAYVGSYEGEIQSIEYEWSTRRYPVEGAEVTKNLDGVYQVEVGRSDVISHPAISSEARAEYVRKSIEGRSVRPGEKVEIPIPRSDQGVEDLLDFREDDISELNESDINSIEKDINEIIFGLFDLSNEEKQVVKSFNETF